MQDIRPKYFNSLHFTNFRTQNKKIFTPFMLFAGEIRDQVYQICFIKGHTGFAQWYIH